MPGATRNGSIRIVPDFGGAAVVGVVVGGPSVTAPRRTEDDPPQDWRDS